MPDEVVCPWIVPRASGVLLKLFDDDACRSEALAARFCLYSDAESSHQVSRINSGFLSQGVINHRLNKPLAMNLYPAGSIQGFLNLFSSEPAPRLVRALTKTTITRQPRAVFRERFLDDKDLLLEYIRYCEIVGKSELIGMEALFSLSLADRFFLFCAASLFHAGVNPLESREDYLQLPIPISRVALCNIIYTTKAPLDRLFSLLAKNEQIVRNADGRIIRRKDLEVMCEWILSR